MCVLSEGMCVLSERVQHQATNRVQAQPARQGEGKKHYQPVE